MLAREFEYWTLDASQARKAPSRGTLAEGGLANRAKCSARGASLPYQTFLMITFDE